MVKNYLVYINVAVTIVKLPLSIWKLTETGKKNLY